MKNAIIAFALAAVCGAAVGFATRAEAGPKLKPTTEQFALGCDGGASYSIAHGGSFQIGVIGETVWLCAYDAGCLGVGQPLAVGSSYNFDFDTGEPLSCRGAGITGVVTGTFTVRGNP